MFRKLRNVLGIAALACGVCGIAASAQAGGYGSGNHGGYGHGGYHCHYKQVVSYRYHQEAYVKHVTVYDDYGCARSVPKTFYRSVQVPFTQWVKVCH